MQPYQHILNSRQDIHDQITRLVAYNLRTLNKIGHENEEITIRMYHLLHKIDDIIDLFKNWLREMNNKVPFKNDEIIKISRKFSLLFEKLYDTYYKFSLERVSEYLKEIGSLRNYLIKANNKFSKDEGRYIVYMEQILEEIFKLIIARMSLNY